MTTYATTGASGQLGSLAADLLLERVDATDVVGGIHAWRAAGLPVGTVGIADVGGAGETVDP